MKKNKRKKEKKKGETKKKKTKFCNLFMSGGNVSHFSSALKDYFKRFYKKLSAKTIKPTLALKIP